LHPGVLSLASHNRPFKVFLINVTMDQVRSKHKITLDEKFKLPKMNYKGDTVVSQRIRKEPKALVTDLGDVPEEPSFPLRPTKHQSAATARTTTSTRTSREHTSAGGAERRTKAAAGAQQSRAPDGAAASSSGRLPAATATGRTNASSSSSKGPSLQHIIQCQGKPVEKVLVDVQLPSKGQTAAGALSSSNSSSSATWDSKDVDVTLAGMELLVRVQGCQPLFLQLPFATAVEKASVELDGGVGVLHLELPYLPVGQYMEKLREAAPVSFGALPVDHAAYLELDA
jgi:hypothetical protein